MKTKRKEIVCIFVINVKIETKIRNIWQESLFYINMSAIILQLCNTKTVLTLSLNLKHWVLDFFFIDELFYCTIDIFSKKSFVYKNFTGIHSYE